MRNSYEVRGDITAIIITSPSHGTMETIISTSKLKTVKEYPITWYPIYSKKTKSYYVVGNLTVSRGVRKLFNLHRLVCGQPISMMVDHINHDTLDNTDVNLRVLSNAENMQNRKGATSTNKSGVRGVSWQEKYKKWHVRIRLNGKDKSFGFYKTIEEAEAVAKEARRKYMPYSQEA